MDERVTVGQGKDNKRANGDEDEQDLLQESVWL